MLRIGLDNNRRQEHMSALGVKTTVCEGFEKNRGHSDTIIIKLYYKK